mgnify:CR=1|jgi:hypothetical protein
MIDLNEEVTDADIEECFALSGCPNIGWTVACSV